MKSTLLLALAAVPLLFTGTSSAAFEPRVETRVLNYGGTQEVLTVPDWATSMDVRAVGGAGGSVHWPDLFSTCDVSGGLGTSVSGRVPVKGGQALVGKVGGAGRNRGGENTLARGGWGSARGGDSALGASGGGSSSLSIDGVEILVARGGGGGGGCGGPH